MSKPSISDGGDTGMSSCAAEKAAPTPDVAASDKESL